MHTLACLGCYGEHSIAIAVDEQRPTSIISTDFSLQHRLPLTVTVQGSVATRIARGPIYVPTANGRYLCQFAMEVGYVRDVDVVLGRDWMVGCAISGTLGPYLADPPAHQRDGFAKGFRWVEEPKTCMFFHGLCLECVI